MGNFFNVRIQLTLTQEVADLPATVNLSARDAAVAPTPINFFNKIHFPAALILFADLLTKVEDHFPCGNFLNMLI